MSVADYLWAVAHDLQTKVLPTSAQGAARDALQHSISVVATLANALEPKASEKVQRPATAGLPAQRAPTDRLRGPAENSAAYGDTAEALAAAAKQCDAVTDAAAFGREPLRTMIRWEKALLDSAIGRIDTVMSAVPSAVNDPRLQIDAAALQTYLRKRLAIPSLAVHDFRQVLGGRSRQTALFNLRGAPGIGEGWAVQRLLPGVEWGPAFATVAAQYAVMDRLHAAGVKLPKPLCFEMSSDDLGSPFLIAERIGGRVVEPNYWLAPNSKPIALDLARQMAKLHAQPIGDFATKLPRLRERSDRQGWIEELNRLGGEWHRLAHWPSVTVSAAIAWMRANVDCIEDRQCLVHNDMVFHNVLAEGDVLTGILDWEQSSVGHPGEDLGYCYPVASIAVDWNEYLEAYYAAGGPRVSRREVDYFALRAILRLMYLVVMGGRDSFENGLTRDVLVASAGSFFSQKLLHRFAQVLEAVLERN